MADGFFSDLDVANLSLRGTKPTDALTDIKGKASLLSALGLGSTGDAVFTQAAIVAAPTALTSGATAAVTSAQSVEALSPTTAEYNAVQADVVALRAEVAALLVDVTNARTALAATLVALKGTGKPMASA